MLRDFPRTRRVGEQLQRELAALIRDEIDDSRIGMVSISGVEVSRDLSHAKVFFSTMLTPGEEQDVDVSLQVFEQQFHVFQTLAPLVREADQAFQSLARALPNA